MNLAIKGHPTRGSEVIEILRMLGGVNKSPYLKGDGVSQIYHIRESDNEIICSTYTTYKDNYEVFSLENFLKKFPYKVGDKVSVYEYESKVRIDDMKWDGFEIQYSVFTDETEWYSTEELNKCNEPYEEETMGTITIDDFKANTKEWLIDKLESMSKDNALQTISNLYEELYKPKYPKTYEECCEVVNASPYVNLVYNISNGQTYSYDVDNLYLYENIRQLKICRDAYWKIAGEQMGLNKPWNPNWCNEDKLKYCIEFSWGVANAKALSFVCHLFLAFPTEKMRDVFYENFKELIEQCKELL